MAERKPIPKSIRFEVFKRDSFKCQYCGKAAPDVVLHVDHIMPVSEGGDNTITNLITACQDCNLGKGARKLDDNSAIEKQRKQLEELNERREQLEMMIQWKNDLDNIDDQALEVFCDRYEELLGYQLNELGKKEARKLIREHGILRALDGIDIASEKTTFNGSRMAYIFGICNAIKQQTEKPYMKDLYYVRAILRNRLGEHIYERFNHDIMPFLEDSYLSGISIQFLTLEAKKADRWDDFQDAVQFLRKS